MNETLVLVGVACVVAAVVGGGITIASNQIPIVKSIPRQVLLGLVGAGIIVLAFAFVTGETESPRAASGTAADKASDYYTSDGSSPKLSPACEDGIFNFCLGSPLQKAMQLLGTEGERYGDAQYVARQWELGDVHVSVVADKAHSICSLTATVASDGVGKIAIPGPLVIGEARMADVLDKRGQPDDTNRLQGEGIIIYDYVYVTGPEGSVRLEYSYATEDGGPDDPGGFGAELAGKPVTSFSANYQNTAC